jgi:hypothetical protein
VDVFAADVQDVVDSTDERRNKPLDDSGGLTQSQLDFKQSYKSDDSRKRLIKQCTLYMNELKQLRCTQHRHVFERPTPDPEDDFNPFDEIIGRCAKTDPELVKMAKEAQAKIETECNMHYMH